MNSRRRFANILQGRPVDRVPYFEEEIRPEVLAAWHRQGLPPNSPGTSIGLSDRLEELELDLEPHPPPLSWPSSLIGLEDFRLLLDLRDPSRLPSDWRQRLPRWRERDWVLFLYVHEGFFLSMGVDGWARFTATMVLIHDDPRFVREMMSLQGRFAAAMAEKVLQDVEIDAAVFSEPIGGNHGPLISPRMYEELVLPSYEPLLDVLRLHGVEIVIFKTYANARLLLPSVLKWGICCLWASEVNCEAMDYRGLRREYGQDLRLIGGLDLDSLRQGKEAIRREILEKVPSLAADGGYIPLADGRIREDVTLGNYLYYRQLLEEVSRSALRRSL
jgi:uroporphyrinogen decarboxylase